MAEKNNTLPTNVYRFSENEFIDANILRRVDAQLNLLKKKY